MSFLQKQIIPKVPFIYCDYSQVEPTERDRDGYAKKLSYFMKIMNKNRHINGSSPQIEQSPNVSGGDSPDQTLSSDIVTSTTNLTKTQSQHQTQTKEEQQNSEVEIIDPQIFKRQGRGNKKKKRREIKRTSAFCHLPATTSPEDVDFDIDVDVDANVKEENNQHTDDIDFIGFMGTNFPARLHDLISRPSFTHDEDNSVLGSNNADTKDSNVISWLPHGRSWIVRDESTFMKTVAKTHFSMSHYKSFIRQVNGWGFRRVTSGCDAGSYYHPLFLRGMPHLTVYMRRETADTCSKIKTLGHCDNVTKIKIKDRSNPDFYTISKNLPIPNHYANNNKKKNKKEDIKREDTGSEGIKRNRRDASTINIQQKSSIRRSSYPLPATSASHLQPTQQTTCTSDGGDYEEGAYFSPQRKKVRSIDELRREEEVRKYQNQFFQNHFSQESQSEPCPRKNNASYPPFSPSTAPVHEHLTHDHDMQLDAFNPRPVGTSFRQLSRKTCCYSSSFSQHSIHKIPSSGSGSSIFKHPIYREYRREGFETSSTSSVTDTNVSSRFEDDNHTIWSDNDYHPDYSQEGASTIYNVVNDNHRQIMTRAPLPLDQQQYQQQLQHYQQQHYQQHQYQQHQQQQYQQQQQQNLRRSSLPLSSLPQRPALRRNSDTYLCSHRGDVNREREKHNDGLLAAIDEGGCRKTHGGHNKSNSGNEDGVLKEFFEELFVNDDLLDFDY